MVKIIFSDFDETMLNYHSNKNYFDDEQVSVLERVNDVGILFCIVTGRNVHFFDRFPVILPYVDYILASNGACIYDVKRKKIIYKKLIRKREVVTLLDYIKEYQFDMFYNSNGFQLYNDDDVNYRTCEQVILSFKDIYLEKVLDDIKNIPHVVYNNICRHGDRYTIDVNDSSVSKGNAVKYLCKYLNIDKEETIGFGDSDNDVSMFYEVGKSISVENGTERIRTLANHITLSSEESGIFKYIDDNILK